MVRSGSSGCGCNDLCMRTFAPDAIASLRFFRGSLGAERHDKRCCDKQAACHATKLGGRSMKHLWWWLVISIASVIFSVYFSILFLFGCTNNDFFLVVFSGDTCCLKGADSYGPRIAALHLRHLGLRGLEMPLYIENEESPTHPRLDEINWNDSLMIVW